MKCQKIIYPPWCFHLGEILQTLLPGKWISWRLFSSNFRMISERYWLLTICSFHPCHHLKHSWVVLKIQLLASWKLLFLYTSSSTSPLQDPLCHPHSSFATLFGAHSCPPMHPSSKILVTLIFPCKYPPTFLLFTLVFPTFFQSFSHSVLQTCGIAIELQLMDLKYMRIGLACTSMFLVHSPLFTKISGLNSTILLDHIWLPCNGKITGTPFNIPKDSTATAVWGINI